MKRPLILAAGLAVTLSGCNSGKADIQAGHAAPVVHDGDPSPDGTPTPDDPSGAIAFVGGIYQTYLGGKRPDLSRYYTAELKAAVKYSDGKHQALGYDPFCMCRDWGNRGYAIQRDDPLPSGGRRVEVEINRGEERLTRVIILTREGAGWRVANIGEGENAVYKP